MKRCIVVGKPNVGKTLLILRLAEHLKVRSVEVTFVESNARYSRKYDIDAAIRHLVGPDPHQTRCLQSLVLEFPAGKGRKAVELIDTTGLTDYIHHDPLTRRAMAQTLAALRQAHIVIHVVDAQEAGREDQGPGLGSLDRQVAAFAGPRGGYCVVANKMDLPDARRGLARLNRLFPGYNVLAVSAATRSGLKEVRRHVLRNL